MEFCVLYPNELVSEEDGFVNEGILFLRVNTSELSLLRIHSNASVAKDSNVAFFCVLYPNELVSEEDGFVNEGILFLRVNTSEMSLLRIHSNASVAEDPNVAFLRILNRLRN